MLTDPRDAFRGQSRSPNIVPFHMLGIVSSCAIVTLSLSLQDAPFSWHSTSKNVVTFKSGLEITQGHWKWYHSIDYVSLLVFYRNFFHKTHRFCDIRLVSRPIHTVTFKPGLASLEVIENDAIRSCTHDFILTFHSNYRPISHRFRDKRRFPSKIANFSHPCVFNAPAEGVSLGIRYRHRGQKSRMMGLSDGR